MHINPRILGTSLYALSFAIITTSFDAVAGKGMEDEQVAPNNYVIALPESTEADLAFTTRATYDPAMSIMASHKFSVSPVKNQDCLGTCVSFAVGAEAEYNLLSAKTRVSEGIYTVEVERTDDCRAGLNLAKGMRFARDTGFFDESHWSYTAYLKALCTHHGVPYRDRWDGPHKKKLNAGVCITTPTVPSGTPRHKFRSVTTLYHVPRLTLAQLVQSGEEVSEETFLSKVGAIKQAISKNKGVILSVPVWWKSDGVDAGWEDSQGRIKLPNTALIQAWADTQAETGDDESNPKKKGWHAIQLHGYDDTGDSRGGYFHFKNSWGWWWGDSGHGTIPYSYIAKYSDLGMYGDS